MRKPLVQFFINLLVPGLSYLLLKKRLVFGWLILISTIAWYTVFLTEPSGETLLLATNPINNVLIGVAVLATSFALAYDAYQLAKEV